MQPTTNGLNDQRDLTGTGPLIDMKYLVEMMNGNKVLIKEIIDLILLQVPKELEQIDSAVRHTDFLLIKTLAHSMRSSFSVLDLPVLRPVLQEMEHLATKESEIERIQELNVTLQINTHRAIEEITIERLKYV